MQYTTCKEPFKSLKETFIFKNFKNLEELRWNELFSDLTLVSRDGIEFKVNKSVIYLASGYFKGMFLSRMKESSDERIVLEFISGHTLEHIISFIYEAEMKTDNAEEIEEIAEKSFFLQVEELHQICLLFLEKIINNKNCLKYWRLADKLSAEKFEDKCIAHIMKFAEELFNDPSFLFDLSVDEMKKLLANRRLPLSEESVFKSAVKWARDKIEMFHEVVNYIRFPLMTKQFLSSVVLMNKTLMQDMKVLEKIIECSRYKWIEESEGDLVFSEFTTPRIGLRQKSFLAVLGPDLLSISSTGGTENLKVKPISRSLFGYTTFNDNLLLICGGKDKADGPTTNSCEYFSPNTREWKRFPPMKNIRSEHECALIDNRIYACGGFSDLKSVEIFDLDTGKWSYGPCMNSDRYGFGLASLNRSLYAIGGPGSSSVECLDPRTSIGWTMINDEFEAYDYTQCFAIDTDIYCFRRKGPVYILDTRMNKRIRWDSDCTEFQNNELAGFRVSELNGYFSVVFPKHNCVEFFTYTTKGEIMWKNVLDQECYSFSYDNRGVMLELFSCSLSTAYH